EYEYALACRLRVEEPVRFLRLLEVEAVREQAPEPDLPICDEARALRLTDAREGPRGMDRELAADHVLAAVEGGRVALAGAGHPGPRGVAPHHGQACGRIRR